MSGSRFAAVAARLCDVQGHSCAHFHAYNRWASNLHLCVGKCPGGTVLTSCIDTRSTLVPPEQGREPSCAERLVRRSLELGVWGRVNAPRFPHKHGVRARCAPVHGVLRLFFFFAHSILFPLHASLSYFEPRPYTRVCRVFRLFGVWPQDPSAQVRGYLGRRQSRCCQGVRVRKHPGRRLCSS